MADRDHNAHDDSTENHGDDFRRLTLPYRRELLVHCYRMLGSLHEAEDLLQETYLRAWRGFDRFEGRSSLRRWLYRIATNACLNALQARARRPLPAAVGAPGEDPALPLDPPAPGATWLEPLPDDATDPAAIVAERGSVRLAFIAALQHLTARQRAVLILREVLGWPADEVAALLQTSRPAVNSALQRARAQLAAARTAEDEIAEPDDPRARALLDRYVAAFVGADLDALARLLREDAILEMPPYAAWFAGRESVLRFMAAQCLGAMHMIPLRANGQPAVAVYHGGRAHAIQVLAVDRDARLTRITAFLDPALFPGFGLPRAMNPALLGGLDAHGQEKHENVDAAAGARRDLPHRA
jgi:RNA polymerase sigma-70 factor (ECF subfamily)